MLPPRRGRKRLLDQYAERGFASHAAEAEDLAIDNGNGVAAVDRTDDPVTPIDTVAPPPCARVRASTLQLLARKRQVPMLAVHPLAIDIGNAKLPPNMLVPEVVAETATMFFSGPTTWANTSKTARAEQLGNTNRKTHGRLNCDWQLLQICGNGQFQRNCRV